MNKGWKAIKAEKNKRRKIDSGETTRFEGSNEEILALEIEEFRKVYLTSTDAVANKTTTAETNPSDGVLNGRDELELEVKELSSTGDGLAIS